MQDDLFSFSIPNLSSRCYNMVLDLLWIQFIWTWGFSFLSLLCRISEVLYFKCNPPNINEVSFSVIPIMSFNWCLQFIYNVPKFFENLVLKLLKNHLHYIACIVLISILISSVSWSLIMFSSYSGVKLSRQCNPRDKRRWKTLSKRSLDSTKR